jgi:hypothetical protein
VTPTLSQIAEHFAAHGGLWRIVPAATHTAQPRPIFALLGVAQGPLGPMATFEGGDLAATVEENDELKRAQWVPVNSRGERIP